MKRVGILVGREVTFPESIIKSINEKGNGEIVAEMVTIGGIRLDEAKKYDLIIDRISHRVWRVVLLRFGSDKNKCDNFNAGINLSQPICAEV